DTTMRRSMSQSVRVIQRGSRTRRVPMRGRCRPHGRRGARSQAGLGIRLRARGSLMCRHDYAGPGNAGLGHQTRSTCRSRCSLSPLPPDASPARCRILTGENCLLIGKHWNLMELTRLVYSTDMAEPIESLERLIESLRTEVRKAAASGDRGRAGAL